jgi:hypothetical protein
MGKHGHKIHWVTLGLLLLKCYDWLHHAHLLCRGGLRTLNAVVINKDGTQIAGNDEKSADSIHSGVKGYSMMFFHRQVSN